MSNQTSFAVCQTLPQGGYDILWRFANEDDAQEAADMVNVALTERGIPSSVSCAYVR